MTAASHDRRLILGSLREHFPVLPEVMTSDEVNGWLNEQTGLDVGLGERNTTAFDRWRQALAAQGIPVWGYSPERIAQMQADGTRLKAHVDQFNEAEKARLAALAVEAPLVTAEQLLAASNDRVA